MEPADTDAIERTERSDHPEIQEAELEPAPAPEPITQHGEGSGRRADAAPAIRQAIEEVQKINRDLESLLLEMEKALETLEEAEVQKYAEEREIEALRSAVRQLNRTRENVQRPPQQQGGPENRSRHPAHREDRYRGRQRYREGQRPPQRNAEPAAPSEQHSIDQPPSQEEPRPDTPHEPETPS